MKKKKLSLVFLSLIMTFVFAISGCADNKAISYSQATKSALAEKIEAMVALAPVKNVEEAVASSIVEVEKSLKNAGITESELSKLLDLEFDTTGLDISEPEGVITVQGWVDEFYSTGITNTKVSKFIYNLALGAKNVLGHLDNDVVGIEAEDLLAEYNRAMGCITEKDFVNVMTAALDTGKSSLNLLPKIAPIVDGETLSFAEAKAILTEAKTHANNVNAAWNNNTANSVVAILSKVVAAYSQGIFGENSSAIVEAIEDSLDVLATYIRVACKVEVAVLNAVDDTMLKAICGENEPTFDEIVIMLGKLAAAAIDTDGKGTGLTKDLIIESPLYFYLIASFADVEELGDIDFDDLFTTMIDNLFNDLPAFKTMKYTDTVPETNSFLALITMIIEMGGAMGEIEVIF